MKTLEKEYCNNVQDVEVNVTDEIMSKVLNKLANNKHGRDLLTGRWVKILRNSWKEQLPDWLVIAQTLLIAKNNETKDPQNYRPIAIQNSTNKLHTSLITDFVMQHCTKNGIVTEEQAAGKIGSWGTTDQLLTNKMIYDEIINNRRNLAVAWLDYKKAFDSVPHSWILES